jgi:carbon storage regulator
MLILRRKCREQIQIGDHIEVTVVDIRGSKVRIGLVAPDGVNIKRGETVGRVGPDRDPRTATDLTQA